VTDQREAIAGIFDRAAETYDQVGVRFFGDLADHLVRDVGLRSGQRVLDVGCGRGAVTFAAAEAVGATGSVLGIDLAPSMVELTAVDATQRGLDHVRVAVMDAQDPDLEAAAFDAVLSSLTLFFLPDPIAALRAWRAATRDGGRLGITTFAGRDDEKWSWLEDVFPTRDPRAGTPDAQDSEDRGGFDSTDGVHGLLGRARWVRPSTVEREHVVRFADAEQWLLWSWSHGMRMFWERTPEDQRAQVRTRALAELASMQEQYGELSVRMQVRYTTADAGG
jgi:ubiquinone/menaquinone biosynthesis C-methylase UbiE